MGLVFFIVLSGVMVLIAYNKGFNPFAWILTGGLIGLIFIMRLPSAKEQGIDEETKEIRIRKGNNTGSIISAVAIGLGVVLSLILN